MLCRQWCGVGGLRGLGHGRDLIRWGNRQRAPTCRKEESNTDGRNAFFICG